MNGMQLPPCIASGRHFTITLLHFGTCSTHISQLQALLPLRASLLVRVPSHIVEQSFFLHACQQLVNNTRRAWEIINETFVATGALPAAHVLNKVPEALAGALLRRPFVTILNTMSDPNLPLTVSEYSEWGDPSGEGIPELWAAISPHKAITHSTYATCNSF